MLTRIVKTLLLLISCALVWSVSVVAQQQTDSDKAAQQAIKALHVRDIPEASLPCKPDECNWWNDLRAAAKAIKQFRASKSEKEKFLRLLKDGLEKSYQPPVANRTAIVLWRTPPEYTEDARRKKINGSVAMAVELRPDGTVGEVKVAQGLDPGLDQMAVIAARNMVFLPAVKSRTFVSSWLPMTMNFNIY